MTERYQWVMQELYRKTPEEFDDVTLNKIISGKISVRNLEIKKIIEILESLIYFMKKKHLVIR